MRKIGKTRLQSMMHLQENELYDLDLGLRSHEMMPITFYIMCPMHLRSLKLLNPTVKEETCLQENKFFALHKLLLSTLYIM